MWCVTVTDIATGDELVRYVYDDEDAAMEAYMNVKSIRLDQNHERVTVQMYRTNE